MKNKILIGIAILLLLLVAVVRYVFGEKFEEFKLSISKYESIQLENFKKEKNNRIDLLSKEDKKVSQLFVKQFDENLSISEKDTSFFFLYLSGTVKYRMASEKYLDCLNSKCLTDVQNEINQQRISNKEIELEKKFGETYTLWFAKLKDDRLLKKISKPDDCNRFFPDSFVIYYNDTVWNDFENFMVTYNSETRSAEMLSKQAETRFASNVATTKNQLRSAGITYFDNQLANRKSKIMTTETESKTYNSLALGLITYNVAKTTFDNQAFKSVADDAFEEQWKYNSLSTGSMPYTYCYGSSNYCDYYGCSRITVQTGSSDVLVTIKDRSGTVVRHGYINAGYSFSFNVQDGSYQVFFYSGSGWNPNKLMTSTSCGTLRGGFVLGEDVTKDSYISLYNQQMRYELIRQTNGNLSTQPSSKNEAF